MQSLQSLPFEPCLKFDSKYTAARLDNDISGKTFPQAFPIIKLEKLWDKLQDF